jgi:lipoprotein-anchoring transpeptidase ErfK/SrfK
VRSRFDLRRLRHGLAIVVATALAATAVVATSARAQARVDVYFLKGEQLIAVSRPGSSALEAIQQLLAGPTDAEHRDGFRTYVPDGTEIRSVSVADGVVTVDLSLRFVEDENAESLLARLSQVVKTAAGLEGANRVHLLIAGGAPLGMFPGVFVAGPIKADYLETPDTTPLQGTPVTTVPRQDGPDEASVRATQKQLIELGYLVPGDDDGRLGPATEAAVIAFQKWEGLSRDGVLGPQTQARLAAATRPAPVTRGPSGRRVEVLLDRQVALAIEDNEVVRALHVSTGAEGTPTPTGAYEIYGKYERWWSTPFREWLLWASAFNGGIAFHQFPDVPVTPGSHGCVRITAAQAEWMFDFLSVGTPVEVIASS